MKSEKPFHAQPCDCEGQRNLLEQMIKKLDGILHREEEHISNANRHEFEESLDFLDQIVLALAGGEETEKRMYSDQDKIRELGENLMTEIALRKKAEGRVALLEKEILKEAKYADGLYDDLQRAGYPVARSLVKRLKKLAGGEKK